jgi:hypothetical protein
VWQKLAGTGIPDHEEFVEEDLDSEPFEQSPQKPKLKTLWQSVASANEASFSEPVPVSVSVSVSESNDNDNDNGDSDIDGDAFTFAETSMESSEPVNPSTAPVGKVGTGERVAASGRNRRARPPSGFDGQPRTTSYRATVHGTRLSTTNV